MTRSRTEEELHVTVSVLANLVDKLYARLDVELAEIRDGLVELDHKTITRSAFEELHTRVDALEETRR